MQNRLTDWLTSRTHATTKGVMRGEGGTIPRAPIHYGGAESLRGCLITAGGVEKYKQCHKYFLQYSKFAFEGTEVDHASPVRPRGRQTCFLPRAPTNRITPLAPLAPRWWRPCECDRFAWVWNYIYAGFFSTQYEIQISHKSNSNNP